jgi:LmbE family N-acetylglucosaminyl deacetylase
MSQAPHTSALVHRAPPLASRVLAIAAHPDDIESWCAGTLALLSDQGAKVCLVLVTAGECGSGDPNATRDAVAARREAEAREAARLLDIAEVVVLGYPDGAVEDTPALRAELVAAIRRWRPDILFTHDPERPYPPYLSHRDHRVVGRVALDAVYPLARDRLAFPELEATGLGPHIVCSVWLFSSVAADVAIDISESFERKLAARLAHESQTPDPAALAEGWRARAMQIGAAAGVQLAEAFTVLELD